MRASKLNVWPLSKEKTDSVLFRVEHVVLYPRRKHRIGQVFGTQNGGETWQEYPLPAGLHNVYTIACA
jgi:hypothetical protein